MNFIIHVSTIVECNGLIALVKEGNSRSYGKWNLPGGHLELGEGLVAGAEREVSEELGINVSVHGFLGIYTGIGANHFLNLIFAASCPRIPASKNCDDDILEQKWYQISEIEKMEAAEILNPDKLRKILTDYQNREPYTVDCIGEQLYAFKSRPSEVK